MKTLLALGLVCALGACQVAEMPVLKKRAQNKAQPSASDAPIRPSGAAFEAVAAKVTDFETCVGIGIVVPGSAPLQCVHDGVTYTGS